MNITEQDKLDIEKINSIFKRIEMNDSGYFNTTAEEMYEYQPFMLELLVAYQSLIDIDTFNEMSTIIFLIWEFFSDRKKIRKIKLTEQRFEAMLKRNVDLLKYLEDETNEDERLFVTASDLETLKEKVLFTTIHYKFDNQQYLKAMDWDTKGTLLIGMKSLIQCLEEIGA